MRSESVDIAFQDQLFCPHTSADLYSSGQVTDETLMGYPFDYYFYMDVVNYIAIWVWIYAYYGLSDRLRNVTINIQSDVFDDNLEKISHDQMFVNFCEAITMFIVINYHIWTPSPSILLPLIGDHDVHHDDEGVQVLQPPPGDHPLLAHVCPRRPGFDCFQHLFAHLLHGLWPQRYDFLR